MLLTSDCTKRCKDVRDSRKTDHDMSPSMGTGTPLLAHKSVQYSDLQHHRIAGLEDCASETVAGLIGKFLSTL